MLKSEAPEELESEAIPPEELFDPLQDDANYEDYNINSYTNLYQINPELGDVATVRERFLDPSSNLTFIQEAGPEQVPLASALHYAEDQHKRPRLKN